MNTSEAVEVAELLCKGSYQIDVVRGDANWSGSDLKGKARRFGASYARSRSNLMDRIKGHGVPCIIAETKHGKLKLVFGEKSVRRIQGINALCALGCITRAQLRNLCTDVIEYV